MQQAKFSLTSSQIEFLAQHKELGYKDKSEVVRTALERFKADVEKRRLEKSAELYCNIYSSDPDLQRMTDAAIGEWPE